MYFPINLFRNSTLHINLNNFYLLVANKNINVGYLPQIL
jgi:hypothetical protein